MTEIATENLKVETPLAQDKIESTQKEAKNLQPPAQNPQEEPNSEADKNWKAFREARKKDREEKEAAERRASEKEAEAAALRAAMEAAFSKQSPVVSTNQYSSEYPQEETEDQRIEKKVHAAIAAREAAYEKERQEREKHEAPVRIQQTFPDYHRVVTQENCDYVDYHYPELTGPFKYMPEGYEKWAAMYKLINKLIPNSQNAKNESGKADANFNKPKSMSSVGATQNKGSPVSNILSDTQKASNWERMQRALKGVS